MESGRAQDLDNGRAQQSVLDILAHSVVSAVSAAVFTNPSTTSIPEYSAISFFAVVVVVVDVVVVVVESK